MEAFTMAESRRLVHPDLAALFAIKDESHSEQYASYAKPVQSAAHCSPAGLMMRRTIPAANLDIWLATVLWVAVSSRTPWGLLHWRLYFKHRLLP
jgi:hypothetical protein